MIPDGGGVKPWPEPVKHILRRNDQAWIISTAHCDLRSVRQDPSGIEHV